MESRSSTIDQIPKNLYRESNANSSKISYIRYVSMGKSSKFI